MIQIEIKPMSLDDLTEVIRIERASFPSPWSEEMFRRELMKNKDFSIFISAKLNDRLVGYGGIWIIIDEAHVVNLAVHPSYRGKGIGRLILLALLEIAQRKGMKRLTLEVRRSNVNAIRFYKRFGFQQRGIRKDYYGSPQKEDAIIMWLDNIQSLNLEGFGRFIDVLR
jgi:ribosomal-protein-alanine N-acetyltransferase